MMHRLCKSAMGVLVLLAGAELYANVSVAGLTGVQIAGVLLLLNGLGVLMHALYLCPMCKGMEGRMMKK
ncbi:MAG: hypothetical protein AB1295_04225 [Candidatus Micrarchaeota archaeon]